MTCCPTCGHAIPEKIGRIELDELERRAVIDGVHIHMTRHELRVLQALVDCHPRAANKGYIMDRIYGIEPDHPDDKIVDIRICKLRKKLKDTRIRIVTIWSVGFRVVFEGNEELAGFQP